MQVEIWCQSRWVNERFSDSERVPAVKLYEGEWLAPIRVGEYITPFEGFGALKVRAVFHDLDETTIYVECSPDYSGEIREELEKRLGKAGAKKRIHP